VAGSTEKGVEESREEMKSAAEGLKDEVKKVVE